LFVLKKVEKEGGERFQTDDELKHSVPNWLSRQDKTYYVSGISKLPG
jgi:hypothetical protein